MHAKLLKKKKKKKKFQVNNYSAETVYLNVTENFISTLRKYTEMYFYTLRNTILGYILFLLQSPYLFR